MAAVSGASSPTCRTGSAPGRAKPMSEANLPLTGPGRRPQFSLVVWGARFLEADAGVLRGRLNARVTHPGRDWDQAARELGMTGVDEMVTAAGRQPGGTLLLRSDELTPAELADQALARAAEPGPVPR